MRPENQLLLFPELDPFKTIIRDIDYVDLATLVDPNPSHAKLHSFDLLPKNKFFLYKTGGVNRFKKELGKVFPYIKNEETGQILKTNMSKFYIRSAITLSNGKGTKTLDLKLHRIVALAFVENDNPEKKVVVDHINKDRLDYRSGNLRWCTYSQNNTGLERP